MVSDHSREAKRYRKQRALSTPCRCAAPETARDIIGHDGARPARDTTPGMPTRLTARLRGASTFGIGPS